MTSDSGREVFGASLKRSSAWEAVRPSRLGVPSAPKSAGKKDFSAIAKVTEKSKKKAPP